jgi:hypothetical protein
MWPAWALCFFQPFSNSHNARLPGTLPLRWKMPLIFIAFTLLLADENPQALLRR